MKNIVVGYITSISGMEKEDKIFFKLAKEKGIELVRFNIYEDLDEKQLEEKVKKCDIFYSSTAEDFVVEFIKTIEEIGKKVIPSSEAYYYCEDKWMLFLKCREHKIPVPETILLSEHIPTAKKELKNFGQWPVILKRVSGTMGQFVEKADNLSESEKIIKKFWIKGSERLPIIAQEFISSPSYRVTTIGDKIVQTALKENKGWKSTGVYASKFKRFEVDKELNSIIKKTKKIVKIDICGMDFLKQNGRWILLEVNSEPAFDFFLNDEEMLVNETINFLKKESRR
ncbi:MAG: ATP-grasp domain-containing protein [Candidatus Pacearchaeota archaeon]